MHIDDKVGKVVAGDLVRSRNNVVVNPFPGGQEIVNIAHNAATHFSYSTRHTKLREFSKMVPGGAPEIRLKNDKCTTRVSARLGMAHSVLRMHKSLRLYGVSYPKTPVAKLTDARFETLAEIEGLMRISGSVCVLDQSEFIFVHALGHPLHERMLAKFRSATVDVVDLPRVSAAPIMPRKAKNTSEFSEVGLEAMRRGALEVERRHNGNKTELLNGKRILIALDEQLATMIDPRTMALKHLPASDRKERRNEFAAKLKEAYIEYARKATLFHHPPAAPVIEVDNTGSSDDEMAVDTGATGAADGDDTGWSDDEDDAPAESGLPPPSQPAAAPEVDWGVQFDEHYKNYRKRMSKVDWRKEFPEKEFPDGDLDLIDDLIDVDIMRVLDQLIAEDPTRAKFGFLPLMATGFKGSVGSLLASSFAERIISCCNLVLTEGNSLLDPEELNMIVVLRMNRRFMEYMRKYYGHLPRQQFNMTIVTQSANVDDDGETCETSATPSSSSSQKRGREKPQSVAPTQASLSTFFKPRGASGAGGSSSGAPPAAPVAVAAVAPAAQGGEETAAGAPAVAAFATPPAL